MRAYLVLVSTLVVSWLVACGDISQGPGSDGEGCSLTQLTDSVVAHEGESSAPHDFTWCIRREMPFDAEGQVPCVVVQGRTTTSQSDECECTGGLKPLAAERAIALRQTWDERVPTGPDFDCLCESTQLSDQQLEACQSDTGYPVIAGGEEVSGWCFVDSVATPQVGDPALTAGCPEPSQRSVRLLGDAVPADGAISFIVCEVHRNCEAL